MGGVFCNGTVGKRQGSSWTARASGAHVGMLEEPVFSDFSFDFVNRVISIRLIGIETRWKKGEGFRELKPD